MLVTHLGNQVVEQTDCVFVVLHVSKAIIASTEGLSHSHETAPLVVHLRVEEVRLLHDTLAKLAMCCIVPVVRLWLLHQGFQRVNHRQVLDLVMLMLLHL